MLLQESLVLTKLREDFFDHQEIGTRFLIDVKRGGLADEMGLGKTAQATVAVRELKCLCVLVICPAIIKNVWVKEIARWAPNTTIHNINGTSGQRKWDLNVTLAQRPTNFVIINFELVNKHLHELLKLPFDGIIVDEAHRLKNRKTKAFEAVSLIAKRFRRVPCFCLSGTPILNKTEELWAMLHIIDPDNHSSYWDWVQQWLHHHKQMTVFQMGGKQQQRWDVQVTGGPKAPNAFKEMVSKYILRRKKEDVLNLPEKMYETVEVELIGDQLKHYESMRDYWYTELSGKEVAAPIWLAAVSRLKQLAISTDLLDPTCPFVRGAKLEALEEIVDDSEDTPIVVFSQFAEVVRRLRKHFERKGISVDSITGDDSETARQRTIERFQAGNTKILVVSTKAGGMGITLTAGRIAVFMDLLWTPAMNAQAVDRLHRIGRAGTVTIYTLEAQKTIEQYINEILRGKQKLFDASIPEDRSIIHWKELLKP